MARIARIIACLTVFLGLAFAAGCGSKIPTVSSDSADSAAKLVISNKTSSSKELTIPEGNADQAFLLIWLVTPSHDPLDQVDGVNLVLKHGRVTVFEGKTPTHYGATLVSIQGGGRGYFTCEARDNSGNLLGTWNSLTVNPGLQRFDLEVGGSGNWTVTRLDYGQVIAAYDEGNYFGTHGGLTIIVNEPESYLSVRVGFTHPQVHYQFRLYCYTPIPGGGIAGYEMVANPAPDGRSVTFTGDWHPPVSEAMMALGSFAPGSASPGTKIVVTRTPIKLADTPVRQ